MSQDGEASQQTQGGESADVKIDPNTINLRVVSQVI